MAETANCGMAPAQPAGPDRRGGGAALRRRHAEPRHPGGDGRAPCRGTARWCGARSRMVDGCWQVPDGPGLGHRGRREGGRRATRSSRRSCTPPTRCCPTARWSTGARWRGGSRTRSRSSPAPGAASARPPPGRSPREGAKVVIAELERATGERTAAEVGGLFVPCDVRDAAQLQEVGGAAALGRYGTRRHPGRQRRGQRVPRAAGDARGGVAPLLRGRPRRGLALLPRGPADDAGPGRRLDRRDRLLPQLRASSRTPSPTRWPSTACSASCGRSGSSTRPRACG